MAREPGGLSEIEPVSGHPNDLDLDRSRWEEIVTIVGACGGCGPEPARSDVRAFVDDWTNQQVYRESLLGSGASHLGFALRANGEGKKVAVAVLGSVR